MSLANAGYSIDKRGKDFNNNFEFKALKIVRDESGNKLILEVIIEGKMLPLINIYVPNRDDPEFYEEIIHNVKDSENPMAGDFNMVLDPDMGCKHYININNPRTRDQVLNLMIECKLLDSRRELNLEARQYTWRRKHSTKQARQDFFLIPESVNGLRKC